MRYSKQDRNKKLDLVLSYVKDKIKENIFPSYKDLKNKFNISFYNITLKDIYPVLGISILNSNIRKSRKCRDILRNELIQYVKYEVRKNHYPTRREIENKFKFRLDPSFKSIKDLYKAANITYKQEISQELKNKKAKLLTKITISILPKLNLRLIKIRGVHDRGVDILTKDNEGRNIGIEIKAHNKYEPIKKRNYLQLLRFLKQEKLHKIILITTTNKFEKFNRIEKLKIINYKKLKKLCLDCHSKELNYIRNASVHLETKEKSIKRQKIIEYTKECIKNGKDLKAHNINKDLNLHIYTYFNSLNDIYLAADVLPPLRKARLGKEKEKYTKLIIEKILKYMKSELNKGRYPTGDEIGEKFDIKHIWKITSMTELYEKLGEKPYHERKPRFRVK